MADGRKCARPGCDNPRGFPERPKSSYCSDACRFRRSRDKRSGRGTREAVPDLIENGIVPVTQQVLAEELRPVIREAITEEVLAGVHQLIGHVPAAIQRAAELLDSSDETLRYQAAALILRHTAGNKNVVPDVNEGRQRDLHVTFALPRPQGPTQADGESTGVIETKECDSCGHTKTLDEFMGQSDRCKECFGKMQAIGQGIIERTDSDG